MDNKSSKNTQSQPVSGALVLRDETVPESSPSIGTPAERPVGSRNAKEQLKRAEPVQKKIKLAEAAVQLQKARSEALDLYSEIMLFSNTSAQCSESETVEFFNILGTEALRKARARAFTNSYRNASTPSMSLGQESSSGVEIVGNEFANGVTRDIDDDDDDASPSNTVQGLMIMDILLAKRQILDTSSRHV